MELVVGEASILQESVNPPADFVVYPTVGDKVDEVVFIYKFLSDVRESDLSIFGQVNQGT